METIRQGYYKTFIQMNEGINRLKKKLKVKTLLVSFGYTEQEGHFFEYQI